MTNKIKGVIVPILTPLNPDETVHTPSLRRLVNYLIDNGAHGIWVSGTTGEFANLTDKQRLISMDTVIHENNGRVPIIGNISGASTQLSINLALQTQEMGMDGIAATPPYYYPNSQGELLDHYRHISHNTHTPLWVYNIPQTVKTIVAPSTTATLASEGAVVGIKDSSGAGEPLAELNTLCQQNNTPLLRFLGTAYRITTAKSVGAHGVIPGIANLIPAAASAGWHAGETNKTPSIHKHNATIITAQKISQIAKGGSPNAASFAGMKSALKLMGVIDHDTVSRPLRPLTPQEKESIPPILKALNLT